jgi:predicted aspartyl protease
MKFLNKIQTNIILNPNIDLIIKTNRLRQFEAFIDTGFDGYLCINQELAKIIALPLTGQAITTINADGYKVFNPVAIANISFAELELPHTEFSIPVILKPNLDKDVIIGSKFLNRFCVDNDLILCMDYKNKYIYFKG